MFYFLSTHCVLCWGGWCLLHISCCEILCICNLWMFAQKHIEGVLTDSLQNRIAYGCWGTDAIGSQVWGADPLGFQPAHNFKGLTHLAPNMLTSLRDWPTWLTSVRETPWLTSVRDWPTWLTIVRDWPTCLPTCSQVWFSFSEMLINSDCHFFFLNALYSHCHLEVEEEQCRRAGGEAEDEEEGIVVSLSYFPYSKYQCLY